MARFFTYCWQYSEAVRYRDGDRIPYAYGTQFVRRGIRPGDTVYIVSIQRGRIYLLGKMLVHCVTDSADDCRRYLGADPKPAAEYLLAQAYTPCCLTALPFDLARSLRFIRGTQSVGLAFRDESLVDPQSLRSVRELSAQSAVAMDQLLPPLKIFWRDQTEDQNKEKVAAEAPVWSVPSALFDESDKRAQIHETPAAYHARDRGPEAAPMSAPDPLRARATQLLQQALGNPAASFRDGQWEAIEALVRRRARLLLVQRTGWGKSAVYFLSTRLLRDQGSGLTLLISPLLALMRNQIEAASRLGIRAATVNSTNREDWADVEQRLQADQLDVLIVSPERFANEDFLTQLLLPQAGRVGLFVVDEAHCISDWGHDFRPNYRRIVRILERLPANVPVCATTATANDRVVADAVLQLGGNLQVSRGPLVRDTLRLQTVALPDDASKLAWLAHHLPHLPGSGIVYAHTIRWTERIAGWLQSRGIDAIAYSAALPDADRRAREERLVRNDLKALVATTALGMGYDKPDLGFVVHFHQPASVVHYYQQVGRAGRSVPRAYGIMLAGGDDQEINDYFIETAFPEEADVRAVLEALERSETGLTITELEAAVNLPYLCIERVLCTLAVESPPPLARLDRKWVSTPHRYDPERRRQLVEHMTRLRREEQAQMNRYREHTGCLMQFLAQALDDPAAHPCGRCAPCQGKSWALRDVAEALAGEAVTFLRRSDLPIEPRHFWKGHALKEYGWRGSIAAELRAEPGRALCILNDSGWGSLVRQGKYRDGSFADELVEALAGLVRSWGPKPAPTWLTCIPSLNHAELVPDLAQRLGTRLCLPFVPALRKVRPTRLQKEMENSWQQAHNLDGAFRVTSWPGMAGPVLLVDDVFDSRWTFALGAALLRQAGSGAVFPLALAANR